jgi:hypothetical protein
MSVYITIGDMKKIKKEREKELKEELKNVGHTVIGTNKYNKYFSVIIGLVVCKRCNFVFYRWGSMMYVFKELKGKGRADIGISCAVDKFPSCDEMIIKDIIE